MTNRIKSAQNALLSWYKKSGRHDLPWRNTQDIYHVYLSEIMLQQTQVNRVLEEYYPQFLKRFPTLQTLAFASLDDVLASWSGLGYYSRARNLHKTAQLNPKGLPDELSALLKLPGIGKYTASAICSFGYNQNVPVVDTNIARVLQRVFAIQKRDEKILWQKAESLLNTKASRAHNLALMDLGSLVCLPQNPKCEFCPLNEMCQGKVNPEFYAKTKKTRYEAMELFYGVFIEDDRIALVNAQGNMYKGMLELPNIDPIEEWHIGNFKHSYTKYRLNVHLYALDEAPFNAVWVDIRAFDDAPISSLTKKAKKFFYKIS
ncbi:MAG: A/G-specific adenine glycosylase [Campylobacterales bacterium]|nr:A/G-specific adenine glycosylase [Campylobacterales bacterium]